MFKKNSMKKIYLILSVLFFSALIITYFYTSPTNPNKIKNEIEVSYTYIFTNNLKVSLLMIFSGPLTMGLGTIGLLVFNGIVLGNALGTIKESPEFFALVIPHGIIEIPVLIFAAAVGIKITLNIISMKFSFKELLKYILIVIIGLLVATGIETSITPIFLKGV